MASMVLFVVKLYLNNLILHLGITSTVKLEVQPHTVFLRLWSVGERAEEDGGRLRSWLGHPAMQKQKRETAVSPGLITFVLHMMYNHLYPGAKVHNLPGTTKRRDTGKDSQFHRCTQVDGKP